MSNMGTTNQIPTHIPVRVASKYTGIIAEKRSSAHLKNSEISLKDAEDAIDKKIFWTVPNDYGTTLSAINQGKVLSQVAAKAAITKNLRDLADAVNGEKKVVKKGQGSFLKGWQLMKGKKMMLS